MHLSPSITTYPFHKQNNKEAKTYAPDNGLLGIPINNQRSLQHRGILLQNLLGLLNGSRLGRVLSQELCDHFWMLLGVKEGQDLTDLVTSEGVLEVLDSIDGEGGES